MSSYPAIRLSCPVVCLPVLHANLPSLLPTALPSPFPAISHYPKSPTSQTPTSAGRGTRGRLNAERDTHTHSQWRHALTPPLHHYQHHHRLSRTLSWFWFIFLLPAVTDAGGRLKFFRVLLFFQYQWNKEMEESNVFVFFFFFVELASVWFTYKQTKGWSFYSWVGDSLTNWQVTHPLFEYWVSETELKKKNTHTHTSVYVNKLTPYRSHTEVSPVTQHPTPSCRLLSLTN